MPSDQTMQDFWSKILDIVLSSMLLLTIVVFLWAQGILILNVLVSFRREKRTHIYNPLLAISTGLGIGLIPFVFTHWTELLAASVTLDTLADGILSSVILTIPVTAIISIIAYIVKETLYMRGKNDNG
uniref:hypothetical protein n=1 Tax=Acetatifactor sp. TaxID=1872090 RepID=UPI004056DDBA